MADGDEVIHHSSDFGRVATHPVRDTQPFLVAPTTGTLSNTLGLDLIPVACMSLHDILFAFDSSFVTKSATTILKELPGLRDSHKNLVGDLPRLSIFGHADPVGEDELNKQLSGRRATAVYGVLTQSVDIWRKLLNHPSPFGDDNWRTQKVPARMRAVVGDGPKTDDDLIETYLAAICPFQLQSTDFLGNGADPDGKADYQGCSSFNPLIILSQSQNKNESKEDRDQLNQPDRRVVIYLFRAGTKVNPALWPCPTATQTTPKCRARFFGPPNTGGERRKADPDLPREHIITASPEIDAPNDTFACRFYSRISHLSPCEGKIIPVFRTIHVFLKLVYKDPEDPAGKVRNFPEDVPVIVDDGGGTVLTVKTTTGGLLDFVYDRDRHQFTLRFELGDGQYFVSTAADKPGPEKLMAEADLPNAVAGNSRFFKVPPKWSLADTDWNVESPVFSNNFFRNLDNPATTVGILENPVRMTLDPHWQYLRFAYFDRALKKSLSILPVTLEGFRKASGSGSPDTRSNWTTQPPETLLQCLPWILRTPPKPDQDTLIQIKTDDDTFIETKDDGSRQLASGTKHDKPEADRLRFYDLPKLWKSSHYFARFSSADGVDASKDGPYEKAAGKPTSIVQPMIFSLDDMVLTDGSIQPIAWTAKDRVAVFKNTFSDKDGDETDLDVSEIGLFEPDTDNTESYLTRKPQVDTGGNYIAEYPQWTRLLVVKGNLFDVFDRRTASGQVIGARAAVRWFETAGKGPPGTSHPSTKVQDGGSFFTIQAYFEQSYHGDLATDDRIGRFDIALLRCSGKADDVELAVTLNYFPYHFNFSPAPDPNFKSTPLDPPLSNDKTEQQKWSDKAVRTMARRWNGITEPLGSFGPGRPELQPDEDDPTASGSPPRIRASVIFFAQSLPRGLAHISWGVYKEVRANAGSSLGTGSLEESDGEPNFAGTGRLGRFVLAHESGHIYSLNDEYVETQLFASAGHFGIVCYTPGSPYALGGPDMMINNFDVTPRYYWHDAEWLHSLKPLAFPFLLKQGDFEYRLPHHPDLPLRSFVHFPLAEKRNTTSNGSGKFDVFLYPFGDEPLTSKRLPDLIRNFDPPRTPPDKFDALLIVLVKFRLHVFKNDDKLVDECINNVNTAIVMKFDNLYTVKGSVTRQFFSGNDTFNFSNAYVLFGSRFLVQNFPQDKDLRKAMKVSSDGEYQALVQKYETKPGVHVEIQTREKGTSQWAVKPEPGAGGKAAPRGRLTLTHEDIKKDGFNDVFRPFFWNILGFPDADEAIGATQLQNIARQVSPDASVSAFPSAKP